MFSQGSHTELSISRTLNTRAMACVRSAFESCPAWRKVIGLLEQLQELVCSAIHLVPAALKPRHATLDRRIEPKAGLR
jgi:hypothetical protein